MRTLLLAALLTTPAVAAPEVKVATGTLTGTTADGIDAFRNIPFAAPPTGAMRWMPPAAAAAWKGKRDATKDGPVCPQPVSSSSLGGVDATTPQSEDCLTLNVFAPTGAKKAPVMVWLHGGAHLIGAGSLPYYDGTALAKRGVVLVGVNYRLGALGYFAHPALTKAAGATAPLANYGAMDQEAALKWVKANIAAFGGDPANVTLFGESAGGGSTLFLLANNKSAGLVQKAIVQSGSGWQPASSLAAKETEGTAIAKAAGAADDADAAALRAIPVAKLVGALAPNFGPFVDGRYFTTTPAKAFADGTAQDVPLVIGANSDEGSLMESFRVAPETVLKQYEQGLDFARAAYGPTEDAKLARLLFGDGRMVAPARYIARAAKGGAPSYLYHFSYVPEIARGMLPGASHGLEVPFVFGTLNSVDRLKGMLGPADFAMSARLTDCWAAFAKTGVPACDGVAAWPAYGDDQLVEFGTEVAVRRDFRKAPLDFHDAVFRLLSGR
jgi:para-nitrobenzyl esterase